MIVHIKKNEQKNHTTQEYLKLNESICRSLALRNGYILYTVNVFVVKA